MSEYDKLSQWDKQYIWHPFTQMKEWQESDPLIVERGEGNYIYDINGNKYLDAISSLWVNVHGHNKKEINEAIKAQLNKISHSTLLGFGNVPSIVLAKKLVEISPEGLNKVFYSDDGSTSVEIALKIAYQYWQQKDNPKKSKKKFVAFYNAYHGDTIGSVSVGGVDTFHRAYSPLLFETFNAPFPYCYRCEHTDDCSECSWDCFKELEKVVQENHEEIAGLVIEAFIQGASGMIKAPSGYMSKVQDLCRKYDILMIVDEVHTGFGKTGKMFACELENIKPDLMTVAKGLTGGYLPVAATLVTDEVYGGFLGEYEEQKTFFHGHSYTGNQLGCAAAIANIDLFSKENTLEKLQPKINLLTEKLERIKSLEKVGDVRQLGIMTGIELVNNKTTKDPYAWEERMAVKVCNHLVSKGFLFRPLGNVIIFMPPLSITEEEIKQAIDSLEDSINVVTLSR